MKRNFVVFLIVAVVVSTLSIWTMVRNTSDSSFQTYANGIECNAQGDFKPEPFDDTMLAPLLPTEKQNVFCSAQGDIKPDPISALWDTTLTMNIPDPEETDEIFLCSAQGDIKPDPISALWDTTLTMNIPDPEETDEIFLCSAQ